MANRYWLGGGWNNIANWSATNNGAGGASIPTNSDNVFWHTIPTSSTYTVDVNANCLDMDWTGATNSPVFTGASNLGVAGSLTFIAAMTNTYSGSLTMNATTTGKTVTTAGLSIPHLFIFNGVGGGWTLQDNFTSTGTLGLTNGSLVTNNKSVTCSVFSSANTNTRSLTLGSSIITITGNWTTNTITNLTFNAGTSQIIMTGFSGAFGGGGATYNNLQASNSQITVSGSNTFNVLAADPGRVLKLTSGTTQTVNSLGSGVPGNKNTYQSTTAGSPASISESSGVATVRNSTLKDITASGGAYFVAISCTDSGGNTGWVFVSQLLVGQIKNSALYWINGSGVVTKVSG